MKNYYDIAIIGGGIGGLMAAYRITERDPSASVSYTHLDVYKRQGLYGAAGEKL